MDYPRSTEWGLVGFGTAAKVGLNLTLFKYSFIQSKLKGGGGDTSTCHGSVIRKVLQTKLLKISSSYRKTFCSV